VLHYYWQKGVDYWEAPSVVEAIPDNNATRYYRCPAGYVLEGDNVIECVSVEGRSIKNDPCFGTGHHLKVLADLTDHKCTYLLDKHKVLETQVKYIHSKGSTTLNGNSQWFRRPAEPSCPLAKEHFSAITSCEYFLSEEYTKQLIKQKQDSCGGPGKLSRIVTTGKCTWLMDGSKMVEVRANGTPTPDVTWFAAPPRPACSISVFGFLSFRWHRGTKAKGAMQDCFAELAKQND